MEWFRKLWTWLTGMDADKYLHFICGGAVTGLVALWVIVAPYAWGAGVLAGLAKEVADWARTRDFDLLDWAATCAGALAVQCCVWLYLVIW